MVSSGQLSKTINPVTVEFQGIAEVPAAYAGLTPGSIDGLYQVNVKVPDDPTPGPDGQTFIQICEGSGAAKVCGKLTPTYLTSGQ